MTQNMSLYAQAIKQAALHVVEAWQIQASIRQPESLEELANEYIHGPDPRHMAGVNSEGANILFDWSFGAEDIPAIVAAARDTLKEGVNEDGNQDAET